MNPFLGKHFLIVGGAGFVGSTLVHHLLQDEGVQGIHIVDNLLSAELCNLPDDPRVTFTEGSIADDTVLNALEDVFDYVFHLATFHGNQSSIARPIEDHANNTLTTLKLFEKIHSFQTVKKVVYSGAGCAVAKKTFDPVAACQEEDTVSLDMDSPYSISKIIGEFYANYYHKQKRFPVVRARFQNVYGPREILGAGVWRGTAATVWRNVVPTFIYKALKGESLPLENGGVATRDFIFVEDIVRGLVACAEHGEPGQAYNLASGVEISIMELAETINALTGNRAPLKMCPKREWDNSGRRYGCPKKSKQVLDFEAVVSLKEGLQETVTWTQENLMLIEKAMNKHASLFAQKG